MMKVFLACVLVAFFNDVQCHGAPFIVSISTKHEYKLGDDVIADVTITNTHSRDYALVTRNTPLEGLISNIFSVSKDGKVIPYDDILLKRTTIPTAEEYVPVPAETSISASVNLARAYSFNSAGEYRVQLKTKIQYLNDNLHTQDLLSNVEVLTFTDSPSGPKLTNGELHRRSTSKPMHLDTTSYLSLAFDGPAVTNALKWNARKIYRLSFEAIDESYFAVNEKPSLYTRWFGHRTNATTNFVRNVFDEMYNAMLYYTFTLYYWGPLCRQDSYGYTYINSEVIYLCQLLWTNIADVGVDSKVDTMVHELTHAISETDDIKYGVHDSLVLARNDPAKAIINAENYCYFAREVIEQM
jgi:hypothetical protein